MDEGPPELCSCGRGGGARPEIKNEQSSARRHPWSASNEHRRQSMFVPRLNDAHVVVGGVGKRQEDRKIEKYGLDLQREITIIREWWNVNTHS